MKRYLLAMVLFLRFIIMKQGTSLLIHLLYIISIGLSIYSRLAAYVI